MPRAELTGQRFGRLVVTGCAGTRRRKTLWRCRCDCGGETVAPVTYLTSGDTSSCGCLHRELAAARGRAKKIPLAAGQTFGRLTVLEEVPPTHKGEIRWRCRCTCGQETVVSGTRLRKGRVQSCGCYRLETMRARAPEVGAQEREKKCELCGRDYPATGPQKFCGEACRLAHHAVDEQSRRRQRHREQLTIQIGRAKKITEDRHEQ